MKTERQKYVKELKDEFLYLSIAKSLKQSPSQCILLPIAAHKETQWLSCSACYRTAHLPYKYCTNCTVCNWTVFTVITQKLLLHIQRVTARHIYCTNTVQTIQSATELYLQQLHRSCCYVFSSTTGKKLSNWYLLKCSAVGGLDLYVCIYIYLYLYVDNHIERLDISISRYLLQVQCSNFDSDKEPVDVTKMTVTLCKLMFSWTLSVSSVYLCENFWNIPKCTVTDWQCFSSSR